MDKETFRVAIARTWSEALLTPENLPVGEKAMTSLRRLARDDAQNTMVELEGSSSAVYRTWSEWYPYWCRDQIKVWTQDRPWLTLSEEKKDAMKRDQDRIKKQDKRVRHLFKKVAKVIGSRPITFDALALGCFGKHRNTAENRAQLSWLLQSERHGRFGVFSGLDGKVWVTVRWKPDTDITEWWKVPKHPENGENQ